MIKIERHSQIIKYLETHNILSVAEIAEILKCSEETIRKDLIELESQNRLRRTRGGAYLENIYDRGFGNYIKKELMKDEKNYIANMAMKFINAKDLIIMDSSTTCVELAKKLIDKKIYVTVITNSLEIANLCSTSENINLISIGGEFQNKTNSFIGYQTIDLLKTYRADISFVSFPTIDMEFGLGENNIENLKIRKTMLKHSKNKILLMDHTKFTDESAVIFTEIEDIDLLITDKELSEEWRNLLLNKGIKVEN
ncbi:DeoR/GlpR family DNA-binding transcription regulator [Peptoniphilus asaccharolyticus]